MHILYRKKLPHVPKALCSMHARFNAEDFEYTVLRLILCMVRV